VAAQNAFKGPLDYVDVAARIVEFRKKFPEGRLRQKEIQFIEFAGKSWVVYTAEAWRTADDPSPAHGTAWEPVPGPTPYTKDSELQNAETAAWGRAMVAALAVDTKKGIASSEEVRNRQGDGATPARGSRVADPAEKIAAAVKAANEATDPAKLDGIEDHAKTLGIAGVPGVRAALEAARTRLGASATDHWAVKDVPA
jgi:hypothetical protein